MTHRERFIAALERRPLTGLVPHFELVFFLTMEAFGKIHPSHRYFDQWFQMSAREQQGHIDDIAATYIAIAQRYDHSAIFVQPLLPYRFAEDLPGLDLTAHAEQEMRVIDAIRERTGDEYFIMIHGDVTYSIPSGSSMVEQITRFYEEPREAKDQAARAVERELELSRRLARHGGLDGFALCSDYCFNSGPFLSPDLFDDLITPYLQQLTQGKRDLGFYVIKHTDGNIMPILDRLVETQPHALHSLDPQGGVDIAEVKRRCGDHVCLIGNVNCGALSTGAEQDVVASARYCLKHGMPGGGYIFSTSNCAYTGLPLERYELMWNVWREEGVYR